MLKYIAAISLILFQILCDTELTKPSDFISGFFKFNDKKSKLYLTNVFNSNDILNENNIQMANGDFDKNDYTDFVTIQQNKNNVSQQLIMLYLWNVENSNFEQHLVYELQANRQVINIMPIDIDQDGQLDLLVVVKDKNNAIKILPLIQGDSFNFKQDQKLKINDLQLQSGQQPFLVNSQNSDQERLFQLIIQNENERTYININDVKNGPKGFSEFISKTCPYKGDFKKFASPNYNAVVDFNGDCRSDIIITSQKGTDIFLEFWIYQDDGKYCLKEEIQILNSQNLKGIAYADFDSNGSTDIILLYSKSENSEDPYIQIALNSQTIDLDSYCQPAKWSFPTLNQNPIIMSLKGYKVPENNQFVGIQNQLRFGDIDLNGYNDLIITLLVPNQQEEQNDDEKKVKLQINNSKEESDIKSFSIQNQNDILNNDYSSNFICKNTEEEYVLMPVILLNNQENDQKIKINEAFVIQNENSNYNIQQLFGNDKKINIINASFFDINENGWFDIYYNYIEGDLTNDYSTIKFGSIYNYIENKQNYFLKMLGSNGQDRKKASIYYGASVEVTITMDNNKQKAGKGVQLSQSSYSPLQLPFSIIGLGRTNNYLQNLKVGYPQIEAQDYDKKKETGWSSNYETIIPNSSLVVYPVGQQIKNWEIDVFIQSTDAVVGVIILVLIVLVILGVSILYCHRREKLEDKKDRIQGLW